MNDDTRAALADLALVGAVSLAAYFVLRRPPLRRAAWRALKYAVGTAAPRIMWQETTRAWALSSPRTAREPGIET